MKGADGFKVGDTAWLPGDWWGHDRDKFYPHRVIERTKTGYVMRPAGMQIGTLNQPESVSTIKANREYLTTREKEDFEWQRANRYKISREVENVDTALLRKVAELIGYEAGGRE